MTDMQATELRDLVANVAQAADEAPFDVTAIRPVPPDKLDFNKLPSHWRSLIANGGDSLKATPRGAAFGRT